VGTGHVTGAIGRPARPASPRAGIPSIGDTLGSVGLAVRLVAFRSPSFGSSGVTVTGVTKNSTGAIIGAAVVQLFRTTDDAIIGETTSDAATGVYTFWPTVSGPFYCVAYKTGSPDLAGTTVNTLIPA
jgi:hypothetical protein